MLPGFWRNVSLANPIYYVINGLRYAVLNVGDTSFFVSFSAALIMTIVFTIIGVGLFQKGYRIKS